MPTTREHFKRTHPQYNWYDTIEAAEFYGIAPRTVRKWCVDGTLVDAGCAIYRGPKSRGKQWLIGMPSTEHTAQPSL
jgi:hypothetical protein